MKILTPPAAVQQGRKDLQYFPTELSVHACVALVAQEAIKAKGILEIKDWSKVEASFAEMQKSGLRMVVWTPMKKNNLGDVIVDSATGMLAPVKEGSRFIQIIEEPKVTTPDSSPKLELVQ